VMSTEHIFRAPVRKSYYHIRSVRLSDWLPLFCAPPYELSTLQPGASKAPRCTTAGGSLGGLRCPATAYRARAWCRYDAAAGWSWRSRAATRALVH